MRADLQTLIVALCICIVSPNLHASERLVDQNAKISRGYVLMQAEMIDRKMFFENYAIPAEVEVIRHGGQALVASFNKRVIEGMWPNNWTLILRFPSVEAAVTWYNSPKYQAVVPYRHAATAYGNMVILEGLGESVIDWRLERYDGVGVRLDFPGTLDPTPEYIVTASSVWEHPGAKFAVMAGFSEIDAEEKDVSVEINVPLRHKTQNLKVTVLLKDTSGHRFALAPSQWVGNLHGGWSVLRFKTPRRQRHVTDSRRDDRFDIRAIIGVEIEFASGQYVPTPSGDIKIRNLNISKTRP